MDWIYLAQDSDRLCEHGQSSGSIKCAIFLVSERLVASCDRLSFMPIVI
jgi:hypothetical protein